MVLDAAVAASQETKGAPAPGQRRKRTAARKFSGLPGASPRLSLEAAAEADRQPRKVRPLAERVDAEQPDTGIHIPLVPGHHDPDSATDRRRPVLPFQILSEGHAVIGERRSDVRPAERERWLQIHAGPA